jgi:hypothetical protein
MADLRERLETYTNAFGPDEAAYFSEAAWAQLHETLREVLAHPEKLMGEPHKPSGASIRCPRCGEKQEVVFKYAAPTKEVKP